MGDDPFLFEWTSLVSDALHTPHQDSSITDAPTTISTEADACADDSDAEESQDQQLYTSLSSYESAYAKIVEQNNTKASCSFVPEKVMMQHARTSIGEQASAMDSSDEFVCMG